MTELSDLTDERDQEVARGFASSARILRTHLRLWIQEELKSLLMMAETLEPTLDGIVKDEVGRAIRRMRDINQSDLGIYVRALQAKIDEVEQGVYDDVLDAQNYLNEGLTGLFALVRELLNIRSMLSGLWD